MGVHTKDRTRERVPLERRVRSARYLFLLWSLQVVKKSSLQCDRSQQPYAKIRSLACGWHFGNGRQTIGHVSEFQAGRRRKITRKFPGDLWGNITHCCKHGNSTMFQFSLTTSLEVLHASICGEAFQVCKKNQRCVIKAVSSKMCHTFVTL